MFSQPVGKHLNGGPNICYKYYKSNYSGFVQESNIFGNDIKHCLPGYKNKLLRDPRAPRNGNRKTFIRYIIFYKFETFAREM